MMDCLSLYGPTSGGGGGNFKRSDKRPTNKAKTGDVVFNSSPEPNGYAGWIYTVFGWLGFGLIQGVSSEPLTLNGGEQFMVLDENGAGVPFLCVELV